MNCLPTTLSTLLLTAALAAPSEAQQYYQLSQWDGTQYAPLGCVAPYQGTSTIAAYYGYSHTDPYSASLPPDGPQLQNNRAQLFLVEVDDGLHAVFIYDSPESTDEGGHAEARFEVVGGTTPGWTFKDEGTDMYTLATPAGTVLTSEHTWGLERTDGGAFGPLTGDWTLEAEFTAVVGAAGDELDGLDEWVFCSDGGVEIEMALALDRPILIEPCPRYRVSQWDGAQYVTLGCVSPFWGDTKASIYYGYNKVNAYSASFPADGPALVDDRATLFLLEASDGLHAVFVYDDPLTNDPGGHAEARFSVYGAPAPSWKVWDESTDLYTTATPSGTVFTSEHTWGALRTDGGGFGPLAGDWIVEAEFTQVTGAAGDEFTGLDSWVVASADGADVPLTLALDRPLRIDLDCGSTCVTPSGGLPSENGCLGLNPDDSLVHVAGEPEQGETLYLLIDDPTGTQPAGSTTFLVLGLHCYDPCGLQLPGLGMTGPMLPGELIVDAAAHFLSLSGTPLEPCGSIVALDLPVGVTNYSFCVQGAILSPTGNIGLTNALEVVVAE